MFSILIVFNVNTISKILVKKCVCNNTCFHVANTTFDDWTIYTLQTVRNCPLEVLVLQSIASLTTYIIGKFACKVQIQTFSFSTPINLVAPVAFTLIMTACGIFFYISTFRLEIIYAVFSDSRCEGSGCLCLQPRNARVSVF